MLPTTGAETSEAVRTTTRRRRLAPDDRRAELIEAAVRVLRSDAPDEAAANWVALVTAEAGAAKGTFYRYFPSWEDMVLTVRERLVAQFQAPLLSALESGQPQDWWELLLAHCDRLVDDASAFPRHHRMVFHTPLPQRADPADSGVALLTRAVETASAAGQFRTAADPEATAALLLADMHTVADLTVADGDRARWTRAFAGHAAAVLSPLSPASAAAGPSSRQEAQA